MFAVPSLQSRLRVKVTGALDAPRTMVFSHGFGTDQSAWERLLPAFEREFRCVLFNHAGADGTADSGWDSSRYARLESFADDLLRLGQELSLQDCILVGHSAGAIIGLIAATKSARLFQKLVLIGASACYRNEPGYEGGLDRADFVHLYRLMMVDYAKWVDEFVPRVTGKPQGDSLHSYLSHMLHRLQSDRALAMATTVLESNYRDWLALVTQPTLILQAREDAVVPASAADYLRAHIPVSRLEFLDATGHFAFLEAPDQTVAAIRRFV